MRNIELKAVYRDLERARQLAETWGARRVDVLHQTDTFFHARFGRLKLREFGDGAAGELIAYHREDRAEARPSDYEIAAIPDPAAARSVLARALGIEVVVIKHRELWMEQNIRIHLDSVEHLGSFIEFEAVLEREDQADRERERLDSLMAHFGIEPEDIQPGAYADLLMARSGGRARTRGRTRTGTGGHGQARANVGGRKLTQGRKEAKTQGGNGSGGGMALGGSVG
jgi:predicted adenylyl cyclase CyaB